VEKPTGEIPITGEWDSAGWGSAGSFSAPRQHLVDKMSFNVPLAVRTTSLLGSGTNVFYC
jgi:hypothetical protein